MKKDQPTAEWIGMHMKDELGAESAMNRVAKETEDYLRTINQPDKRLAIVATGWATYKGIQPPLPFYLPRLKFHGRFMELEVFC